MKKYLVGLLIASMLASCGAQGNFAEVDKSTFQKALDSLKTSAGDFGKPYENVNIKSSINIVHEYNYKEGEFYSFRHLGVATLIIPINTQDFTWKENGKYYHAEIRIVDDSTFKKEITESEFNELMASHKKTIQSVVQNCVYNAELRMENYEGYTSLGNYYYYNNTTKQYLLKSTGRFSLYTSSDIRSHYSVKFDEERPYHYTVYEEAVDSKTECYFNYGEARFEHPSDDRLNS